MHKRSTAIAIAALDRRARFVGTVGPHPSELFVALDKLGPAETLQIVYEADTCGYGPVRALRAHGYACEVIAPAKVAHRPGDRVKTDRRDVLHLAEQSLAGALTAVWVLEEAGEAIRDLSQAREDKVSLLVFVLRAAKLLDPEPPPYQAFFGFRRAPSCAFSHGRPS